MVTKIAGHTFLAQLGKKRLRQGCVSNKLAYK